MTSFHPVSDLQTHTLRWVEYKNGEHCKNTWTEETVPAWLIAGTFARYYATDRRSVTFG